jgi:antirestriction protein
MKLTAKEIASKRQMKQTSVTSSVLKDAEAYEELRGKVTSYLQASEAFEEERFPLVSRMAYKLEAGKKINPAVESSAWYGPATRALGGFGEHVPVELRKRVARELCEASLTELKEGALDTYLEVLAKKEKPLDLGALVEMYVSIIGKSEDLASEAICKMEEAKVKVKDVEGNECEVHPEVLTYQISSPLTDKQKEDGLKREVVLTLKVASGYEEKFLKAVKKAAKGFKVEQLEKARPPHTQNKDVLDLMENSELVEASSGEKIVFQSPDKKFRILEVPVDDYRMEDLKGDAFDFKTNPETPQNILKQEEEEFEKHVEEVGVYGYQLEQWNSEPGAGWETVDSLYGFVGPYKQGDEDQDHYIIEEMKAEIKKMQAGGDSVTASASDLHKKAALMLLADAVASHAESEYQEDDTEENEEMMRLFVRPQEDLMDTVPAAAEQYGVNLDNMLPLETVKKMDAAMKKGWGFSFEELSDAINEDAVLAQVLSMVGHGVSAWDDYEKELKELGIKHDKHLGYFDGEMDVYDGAVELYDAIKTVLKDPDYAEAVTSSLKGTWSDYGFRSADVVADYMLAEDLKVDINMELLDLSEKKDAVAKSLNALRDMRVYTVLDGPENKANLVIAYPREIAKNKKLVALYKKISEKHLAKQLELSLERGYEPASSDFLDRLKRSIDSKVTSNLDLDENSVVEIIKDMKAVDAIPQTFEEGTPYWHAWIDMSYVRDGSVGGRTTVKDLAKIQGLENTDFVSYYANALSPLVEDGWIRITSNVVKADVEPELKQLLKFARDTRDAIENEQETPERLEEYADVIDLINDLELELLSLGQDLVTSSMSDAEFVDYFLDFYGPEGTYKDCHGKKKITKDDVAKALKEFKEERGDEYVADSFDREKLLFKMCGVVASVKSEASEAKDIKDLLMAMNSSGGMGFKYPIGNKELTEKLKKYEEAGKIHYNKHYDKWEKGKAKTESMVTSANQLGLKTYDGKWPAEIKTEEYGTFRRVYPKSDEGWTCLYNRVEDGRNYTFDTRHQGQEFTPSDKIKKDKAVKSDYSDTEPSLYVGTYNKYNNGNLAGKWMKLKDYADKDEFYKAAKELHKDEADPEFMFQDYEGFPSEFYDESGLSEELMEWVHMDDEDKDILAAYVNVVGKGYATLDKAKEAHAGSYDSKSDWAEQFLSDTGGLQGDNASFYLTVTETDRHLLAGEDADSYVDNMSDDEIVEQAEKQDEYDAAETDEAKEKIVQDAKEELRSKQYDEVYEALNDPYHYYVEEQGIYSPEDFAKASFVSVDYDKYASDAEMNGDISFGEAGGKYHAFYNH